MATHVCRCVKEIWRYIGPDAVYRWWNQPTISSRYIHPVTQPWHTFIFHLRVSLCRLNPAVSLRAQRPTSSFVYPGMWDILTGWPFIDSTQLWVPFPSLFLFCTRLFPFHYGPYQPPQPNSSRVVGDATQTNTTFKVHLMQLSHCGKLTSEH